jgi:hypothetical protein
MRRQEAGDGHGIHDHQVTAVEAVGVAEGHGSHQRQKGGARLAQTGVIQQGRAGKSKDGGKAVIAVQQRMSRGAGSFLAVTGQGEQIGEQLQVAHLHRRG